MHGSVVHSSTSSSEHASAIIRKAREGREARGDANFIIVSEFPVFAAIHPNLLNGVGERCDEMAHPDSRRQVIVCQRCRKKKIKVPSRAASLRVCFPR